MIILQTQIFIYPFTLSSQGERFNTFEYGLDDSDVDGWNVQAFGLINGTAGILDDGDFPDIETAFAYAQKLSRQYQITIDCMEDVPSYDAVDHDNLKVLEMCG